MAEKQTNKDRMREIVDNIETGIKELFESDKYRQYLSTMSRFHRYSVNNTMLIYMQRPNATHVAGFNKWRDQFGRNVMKGEKGIKIIAPTPYKKKVEEVKLDPDTKAPMFDKDGNAIMEEKEIKIPMYKVVSVFDVSQTEGKPLPQLASDLSGNVRQYEVFMEALRRSSPVPMEIKPIERDTDGYFSSANQSITIQAGMSEVQTVCAAVHEIAHAKLHNYEKEREAAAAGDETAEPVKPKDRRTEEVEAESISYAVCQYYGIETADNSFGYIATWSQGKELKELRASLETINKTASGIITDIDRHFAEICKERGISPQIQGQTEIPEQAAEPVSPFLTQEEITAFSNDFAAFMVKVYEGEPAQGIPAADEAGIVAWTDEKVKNHNLRPISDALLDVYKITGEDGQPRFTEQSALMDRLVQLNQREFVPTVPEPTAEQPEPTRYEYKLHSNFNRTTPDDNTYIQQYTVTKDWALIPGDVLYVGAYEKCLELQEALKSGTMTPEQVKALEQSEKLYLVSDTTYLHIQRSDEGFDYTLYDKETMRLLDGGQLDNPDILLSTACMEICKLHDLDTYAVRLASLDMLETLQEAQLETPPAPSVGEDMEGEPTDGTETAPETMLPDSPEQAKDEPLPDPTITPKMMEYYGYTDSDMLPLSKDRAMELAEKDITVYMLYADNTEAMVFDTEDVVNHDGLFGISREDEGAGLNTIAVRLNEAGFLPPSHYKKTQGTITHENLLGNGKWQTRTVGVILRSEVYTGDLVQGQTKTVDHKQVKADADEWTIVRGTHEAIISREQFDAVQEILNQTAQRAKARDIKAYTPNILKGKVFCAHCGGSLHRQRNIRKKSDDVYLYHCLSRSRISKDSCPGATIREDMLLDMLADMLQEALNTALGKYSLSLAEQPQQAVERAELRDKITSRKQEIQRLRGIVRSLYENLIQDVLTKDEYFDYKEKYESKIADIALEVEQLEDGLRTMDAQLEQYRALARDAESIKADRELTAALIERLIDRIEVSHDKQITVYYRFQSEFENYVEVLKQCRNM